MLVVVVSLLLLAIPAAAQDKKCVIEARSKYGAPVAADGWAYRLIDNRLSRPRGFLFDSGGALLVVESGTGIRRINLKDHGGTCVEAKTWSHPIENSELNHGIALSNDGETLYASTINDVLAWSYNATNGNVGSPRKVITNMTNSGHSTRTLLMSKSGRLIVSRGSAGNLDPLAMDISTGHCQLRSFDLSKLQDGQTYNYATDGNMLAWGLRNSVGVAEHPDGGIWSVENSVDNLRRRNEDIHNDNPAEELNFHGPADGSGDGKNHGYPVCFAMWGTGGFPDKGNLTTGKQFAVDFDIAVNGNKPPPTDEQCNTDYVAPVLAFQAHTAPLDISFHPGGAAAYVTFHGSWNRDKPVGYSVSMLEFSNGRPSEPGDSQKAVKPILSNKDVSKCPSACFRPVGLAQDSLGRLWFSSDSTGELYVLVNGKDEFAPASDAGRSSAAVSVVVAAVLVSVLAGVI